MERSPTFLSDILPFRQKRLSRRQLFCSGRLCIFQIVSKVVLVHFIQRVLIQRDDSINACIEEFFGTSGDWKKIATETPEVWNELAAELSK